jgi:predicted transcriptional regulator
LAVSKTTNQEASPTTPTISDQLREIIRNSGKTAYAVGKLADIDPGMVKRFLDNDRGMRVATLDKLAAALGLRLCQDRNDAK